MPKWFNTAGPCIPSDHYMVDPSRRLGRVLELIERRQYFTLNAGRQTGKTTSLLWLEKHLNARNNQRAVWVDIQTARDQPDLAIAMGLIIDNLDFALARHDSPRPDRAEIDSFLERPQTALLKYLTALCHGLDTPLVLLIDEADGLAKSTMTSFLTQLRQGYLRRTEHPFVEAVILVGHGQGRDYTLVQNDDSTEAWAPPFNITAEAATLTTFTETDVAELLEQHTEATGQPFTPDAARHIFTLGRGHPWLTNALAEQITDRDIRDRNRTIDTFHVDAAKETLIIKRRGHIDALIARLREPRVQRVIAPMLTGHVTHEDSVDDDLAYVQGLGLITATSGRFEMANPIYQEVIPRVLTYTQQMQIDQDPAWYIQRDGQLDLPKLLRAWQKFWRKEGHIIARGFRYLEAGPHLMLMAFLQRIVDGIGHIERTYGLGRGALDLLITHEGKQHVIEAKLRRTTEPEAEALDQITRYLENVRLDEGWLVLFDPRPDPAWSEMIYTKNVTHAERTVHIVGC